MSPALGGTGYAAGGSMGHQFIAQAVGVGVTAAWSAVMSYVLAVGLGKIMPMRATEDDEREGLDITSHGERAWELD